jgi:glyoxylase-like metal-dependent hydrolase (beta-lactamase superfamily II)
MKTITTELMKIAVNCYLVQTGAGFFLVDTGMAKKQASLDHELEQSGCRPGDLKLIILTHGDSDHSGNSAYLRERYGAKIAMHRGDLENVESGDMFANKRVNPFAKMIARILFFITGLGKFTTFTPDILLENGQNLSEFGWDATVLHLPGHSKGSIGILTPAGDLFCGDLVENTRQPAVNTLGDDVNLLKASVEKLKGFSIHTLYPGHGKPFLLTQLSKG